MIAGGGWSGHGVKARQTSLEMSTIVWNHRFNCFCYWCKDRKVACTSKGKNLFSIFWMKHTCTGANQIRILPDITASASRGCRTDALTLHNNLSRKEPMISNNLLHYGRINNLGSEVRFFFFEVAVKFNYVWLLRAKISFCEYFVSFVENTFCLERAAVAHVRMQNSTSSFVLLYIDRMKEKAIHSG